MSVFKESMIKKMMNHTAEGTMSLSSFVYFLNSEAYKFKAKKGDLVTMMDVVRTLECFLVHNPNIKSITKVKVNTLIDYMKSEVIEGANENLKQ